MEVEQHTMEQRTLENEQDTDNAESSFEVLMKSIKAIEKQSKSREQQLTSKLEQERLKWQQEKQELLEQLRMKQTPTKNIKSPSRPVLGALTPNKQHAPASKASQATSEISFQDIFTSPVKKSQKPNSSTTSHAVSLQAVHPPRSPNRLEAELRTVKKELKRSRYKYEALLEAQEEILRRRNQDRDKWRHFKNVVKMATDARPDFQLELRKADAFLKKRESRLLNTASPPAAAANKGESSSAAADDLCTAVARQPAPAPSSAAPLTTHTPTKVGQAPAFLQAKTTPAENPRREPLSPSPTKRTHRHISSKLKDENTHLESSTRPVPNSLVQAPPASVRTAALPTDVDMNTPVEPDDEPAEPTVLHDNNQLDNKYLDWAASAALQEVLEEIDAVAEAEVSAVQEWEHENDLQAVHRICEEYDPQRYARRKSPVKWQLDGKEVIGPAVDPVSSPSQEEVNRKRNIETKLSPSTSNNYYDDEYELYFWSNTGGSIRSLVESVPTEIEFGSYQPATQDSVFAKPNKVKHNTPAKQRELTSPRPCGNAGKTKTHEAKPAASSSAVPYLYPLPQDLQSRIPPDQDILEESVPVRKLKMTLFSPFSQDKSASGPANEKEEEQKEEREKIWRPFESRDRRGVGSSVAVPSVTSQSSSASASHIKSEENDAHDSDDGSSSDDEATEASSSPCLQHEEAAAAAAAAAMLTERRLALRKGNIPDDTKDLPLDPSTSTIENQVDKAVLSPTSPQRNLQSVTTQRALPGDSDKPFDAEMSDGGSNGGIDDDGSLERERGLPSYRPSTLPDNHISVLPKRMSDEKIGPRQVAMKVIKKVGAPALSDAPQDYCETYLARLTGQVQRPSKPTHAPLGKPITGKAQLDNTPKGTPTAWHNMSSKRRISGTASVSGTPSAVGGSKGSKQALIGPRVVSAAVNIRPSSAQSVKAESPSNSIITHAPAHNRLAPLRVNNPATVGQSEKSASSRHTALEIATGVRRPKAKKSRKSGQLPDEEVMSDLDAVGSAILTKGSFTLAPKRPVPILLSPDEKPSKKPRYSLDEVVLERRSATRKQRTRAVEAFPSNKTSPERERVRPDAQADYMALIDKQSTDIYIKNEPVDACQSPGNSKTSTSSRVEKAAMIKAESNDDEKLTEESEEYKGQHFMRKLHQQRNKELQTDPLKYKGRGAYAKQKQAVSDASGDLPRPEVAYKETVRGREARAAIHGVDCPCCSGYYEYKTRNLPLEERAKAAAEMANDVSRHRQNWENAESPPGYWQMGFPSTLQVERLNEEAARMKRDKREREQKERFKGSANNCEGRRTYKVV